MKKTLLTIVVCLYIFISFGNPSYRPEIYLNAFSFDENQNWKLSIYIWKNPDSISISSATSKSTYIYRLDIYGELILNKDSLNSDFNLNNNGDSITITYYLDTWQGTKDSMIESFIYGNYPGATLPKPNKNQYIGRICERIMGTDYHTVFNGSGKSTGILHGKVYDKENHLLTSGSFSFDPIPISLYCLEGSYRINGFNINSNGTFSASVHSNIYNLNSIVSCSKYNKTDCVIYTEKDTLAIENLQFSMLPDTTVEMDIHLLDDYVGMENIQINSPDILKIFPNPSSSNGIQYKISVPVKSTNCFIQFYNATGQIIWHQNITDNRGLLTLPSYISTGTFILQLWINGKAYQSKQLVVNR